MPRKSTSTKPNDLEAIYLPANLVAKARNKLEVEREIELETFVSIYLRLMLRTKNVLQLADILPFGKYSGERVEDIVRIDTSYIAWLLTQDGRTKFGPDVLELVGRLMEAE